MWDRARPRTTNVGRLASPLFPHVALGVIVLAVIAVAPLAAAAPAPLSSIEVS